MTMAGRVHAGLAIVVLVALAAACSILVAPGRTTASSPQSDSRLTKSVRFERGGWIYVHLEGTPSQVGFQHGYLLATEIADAVNAYKLDSTHRTRRDWNFFRETSRKVLWPHIEEEYRQELQGITDGVRARGVQLDLDDIVALNGALEIPDYYVPWLDKREHAQNAPKLSSPGNCSAFAATGSYTKDHGIGSAHNNWTS